MKILLIFLLACIHKIPGFPISDYRIIFPDDGKIDEILDRIGDLKIDQRSLLDDPNLLKSENATEKFLFDEEADPKFENGNFFQGDMILMKDQMELVNSTEDYDDSNDDDDDDPFGIRTGVIWEGYRWPKNKYGNVIVPYVINKNDFSSFDKSRIMLAMQDLEHYTCVKFTPRSYERDYVHIYSGVGCNSALGKHGGRQLISLQQNGCLSRGTILHELIHSLGYDHMQNHENRDNYVYILWNNIKESQKRNFVRVNPRFFSNFGTSYDYYSVMHYEPYSFSRNGRATVIPKDSRFNKIIGQRNGLSSGDADRINNMYKCYN